MDNKLFLELVSAWIKQSGRPMSVKGLLALGVTIPNHFEGTRGLETSLGMYLRNMVGVVAYKHRLEFRKAGTHRTYYLRRVL